MVQVFFLTEIYLVLSALYLLADRYGARFLTLINLKTAILVNRKNRKALIIAGFVIAIALCFFPTDPGPIFLGDLIPVLTIIFLLSMYIKTENLIKKRDRLGFIILTIATLHFLFPQIVLI